MHYPEIVKEIKDYSIKYSFNNLPWSEQVYLFIYEITSLPKGINGKFKKFWSFNKGYSKTGVLLEKQTGSNLSLDDFLNSLEPKDLLSQKEGGYISQKILENENLFSQLIEKYWNLVTLENLSLKQKFRCMIYMACNKLVSFPKCENCDSNTKFRQTKGEFSKTCSLECQVEVQNKSGYRTKIYKTPSGKEISVQGYEPYVLNYLYKNNAENAIVVGNKNIKEWLGRISYEFKGGFYVYFPDIFLLNYNKLIEVKSTYTFNTDKARNLAKREACLKKNIDFEFYIWDAKQIILSNDEIVTGGW